MAHTTTNDRRRAQARDIDDDCDAPAACLDAALAHGATRKKAETCEWDRRLGRGTVGCPACPYAAVSRPH